MLNLSLKIKWDFLWGLPKIGGGVLDRYLLHGVVYQNRLKFDFKETAPKDISILSSDQYFNPSIIGPALRSPMLGLQNVFLRKHSGAL